MGITPPPFRDYTAHLLKGARAHYQRLVIPCAGRFAFAHLALSSGWLASQCDASDVALPASLLGYCAAGMDATALGVQVDGEGAWTQPQGHGAQYAAQALFALKFLSLDLTSEYGRSLSREMKFSREAILASLAFQVQTAADKLAGLKYEVSDLWTVIDYARDDPAAIIAVHPPLSGGDAKLLDTAGCVTWSAPNASPYEPKADARRLHDLLMQCAGLTLMTKGEDLDGIPEHHVVCAAQVSPTRTDYLLSNKPAVARELLGIAARPLADHPLKKPKYPPLTDADEISADAKVSIVRVEGDVAIYYRELWAHAMPASSAQAYFLLLVNGKAAMVIGTMSALPGYFWNGAGYLHWGISPPSHRRLQRLALSCLTTEVFRSLAFLDMPVKQTLRSTCFSRHPQVNSYRGLFKQIEREEMEDGRYKLTYEADYRRKMTWASCFAEWHTKEAQRLGSDTL